MNKMLIISEVAAIGKSFEKKMEKYDLSQEMLSSEIYRMSDEMLSGFVKDVGAADAVSSATSQDDGTSGGGLELILDDGAVNQLSSSRKARVTELLGDWDEPPRGKLGHDTVSI